MIRLLTEDGIDVVVSDDDFYKFLSEKGRDYNTTLEYGIRKKLGQNLNSVSDLIEFKNDRDLKRNMENASYADEYRPDHLRFEMCGQRDDDGGIEENRDIFKLFNLPITVKSSYVRPGYEYYEDYNSNDFGNILVFHKGIGQLYQRDANGFLNSIAEFSGYGTVEILVKIINLFSKDDVNYIKVCKNFAL